MTPEEEEKARYSQSLGPTQGAIGVSNAGTNVQTGGAQTALNTGIGQTGNNAEASTSQQGGQLAHDAQTGVVDGVQSFLGAVGDAGEFGKNALDDTFSAETVNGPAAGQWGSPGTVAAGYNAGAVDRGQQIHAGATGQGQTALNSGIAEGNQARDQMGGISANLLGQAGAAGTRDAPTTNYAGADRYASLGDSSRNTANALVNEAGSSAGQDAQLAALNQFAGAKPGASAAQAQLAAAGDQAQLSALSMARSGRGAGDSAASLRDAMFSNATTQGQNAGQLATLRAQEEATFRQQQLQALDAAMGGSTAIRGSDTAAAQTAQGTRAQDLQAQGQAAGQSQFLTTTEQNQTQINDAAKGGLLNNALGFANEGNQTNLGFQQLGNQTNLGFEQLGTGAETDFAQLGQNALNAQSDYEIEQQQMALDAAKSNQAADLEKDSGLTGMLSAGAGALFALSDERVKELEHRETALADALETVGNAPGYSYKYKNPDQPGAKPGRQYGPMAQDLEKGPLGDTVVMDTPQGKMVDHGRVAMLDAAAITELNRKVEALEAALGKRKAA